MKIYLARNHVQAGPYTLDELNTMLASQEVVLDDLIWHAPMSQWQRLGDLTAGQLYYQPADLTNKQPLAELSQSTTQAFGDNVELQNKPRRVSVAELYGQKPAADDTPAWQQTPTKPISEPDSQTVYASIGSRFLAVMINVVLFMLTLLPFLQQFIKLNPDPVALNTGNFATRMAYAQELAAKIPADAATLSSLLLLAYCAIQLILIISRGQSFGKMAVGIRTVDAQTFEKPSFFKGVVLRVLVLFFIYQLSSGLPLPINMTLILLMVNYFIAAKSTHKQGWHDKLAGTVVVKTAEVGFQKAKK